MSVKEVVLSHISECERDVDGAFWCTTHEALMRGLECTVMLDALDLAEAVAERVNMAGARTKSYGLRLNCDKQGCAIRHSDHGDIRELSGPGWQEHWYRAQVNGHACDQVTRWVIYKPWELEPEP